MSAPPAVRRQVVRRLLAALIVGAVGVLLAAGPAAADPPNPAPEPAPAPGAPAPNPNPPPKPTPPPDQPKPIPPPPTNPPAQPPPGTPSPGPTPSPSPGPPPPGWTPPTPPPPSDDDDPAWYDIPGQIKKAIVNLFVWMAKKAVDSALSTLGQSWLSTPDVTKNPQVTTIWTTSLVVANAVYVLFIVAAAFLATARETLQTRYGLKQLMPRVLFAGVATNCSLIIGQKAIEFVNALTVAIMGEGVDGASAAKAIGAVLTNAALGNNLLLVFLVLAVVVLVIVLTITFIVRLCAIIMLIGFAPLALICHATPFTEGLAALWWRSFLACLGLQLAQAVIVLAMVRVFLQTGGATILGIPTGNGGGLLGVLVCLTMLWVLVKLPSWMKMYTLGPLGQSNGRGLLGQLLHTYLTLKTLGAAAGLLKGGGAAAAKAAGTKAGTAGRRPEDRHWARRLAPHRCPCVHPVIATLSGHDAPTGTQAHGRTQGRHRSAATPLSTPTPGADWGEPSASNLWPHRGVHHLVAAGAVLRPRAVPVRQGIRRLRCSAVVVGVR